MDETEPAPAKQRRAGKPKVKTGCATCKIRKVKCDEAKPVCLRCVRFGSAHDCVYNVPIQRKIHFASHKTMASLQFRPIKYTPLRPRVSAFPLQIVSASFTGDEAERRYFKLYQSNLAGDFGGWFENPFWTRVMPQQCHHEPTIRHAILALSAMYSYRASRIAGMCTTAEHLKFAIVQQTKAIASLQAHMSSKNPQMRLVLIASLLFACVESFHDNLNTVAKQISSGLAILKYWQSERRRAGKEDLSVLDTDVRLALGRFELQIRSYLALNPLIRDPTLDVIEEQEQPKLPDMFISVEKASYFASNLSNNFLKYLRRSPRYTEGEVDIDSFQPEYADMGQQISSWERVFLKLFRVIKESRNTDARKRLAAFHLLTSLRTFEIMYYTSRTKDESIFDGFKHQFTQIVEWCQFMYERDSELRSTGGMGAYLRVQFGMGIIMPLFYTATRCRDCTVRRSAIAILKDFPSKNGMWDSLMVARVAEWVVEREEGDGGDGYPPEERRVRASTLKMNLVENGIDVECIQAAKLVKETISWKQ